jgi:two-component system CheB/CheR fusion protein
LFDAAADVIGVFDHEQRFVYLNPALERATGVPASTLLGRRNDDAMLPEEAALWSEALDEVRRSGRDREIECTIATPRGPRRFASVITRVPGDLLCAVSRDITELAEARRAHEAALARRAGVALDRTRRLQELTAALSGAVEKHQVVSIMVDAGRSGLGAGGGFAWLLRDDATLELAAFELSGRPGRLDGFRTIPMTARLPVCDVIRSAQPMMFENLAAMTATYPAAVPPGDSPFRAWAVIPFVIAGRAVGAVSFSFVDERVFSSEDREMLTAMIGQASLALERCLLIEAERRAREDAEASDEQLRIALTAARAATWRLDLATMTADRDPAYRALLGVGGGRVAADFAAIHPEDRPSLQAEFARTLRDGTPFEPEVRVQRDDGTYMWVRSHGRLIRDSDGTPTALAGVIVDIDEAKQASLRAEDERRIHKEQLEDAVARARLADRRKDEFLAMLGHELRNPLAPIATALELMELKDRHVMQKEREVIRRQVDHLSRLIDDLLDVSRITRGKIQLTRQVLEISTVLAKAIEMASPLFEKRMQRLVIDVPRRGLAVDADPMRLAQVFQNLLTNASKYSEPSSQIAVRARRDGERVVVELADHGIGIAPELLPRLFELFVQGDRALDRAQGGLGIGLTIARSLCELHGGTISVASAGTGRGSTFTVALPRAEQDEAPEPARPGEPVAPAATGMRVLVVDDNVDAALTLQEFLTMLGHEAAIAHDGVAALEIAAAFRPDIAVLDIGLPVMDGYELARKLRDQLDRGGLRLIAVTGYGQEADRARARDAGFDHHLVKPIALDALMPLLAPAT